MFTMLLCSLYGQCSLQKGYTPSGCFGRMSKLGTLGKINFPESLAFIADIPQSILLGEDA